MSRPLFNPTDTEQMRRALTWSWVGPVVGIVAMIGLLIRGIHIGDTTVIMIAIVCAVALGAVWSSSVSVLKKSILTRELEEAEQSRE